MNRYIIELKKGLFFKGIDENNKIIITNNRDLAKKFKQQIWGKNELKTIRKCSNYKKGKVKIL